MRETVNDLNPDRINADAAALAETAQSEIAHIGDEVKEMVHGNNRSV